MDDGPAPTGVLGAKQVDAVDAVSAAAQPEEERAVARAGIGRDPGVDLGADEVEAPPPMSAVAGEVEVAAVFPQEPEARGRKAKALRVAADGKARDRAAVFQVDADQRVPAATAVGGGEDRLSLQARPGLTNTKTPGVGRRRPRDRLAFALLALGPRAASQRA